MYQANFLHTMKLHFSKSCRHTMEPTANRNYKSVVETQSQAGNRPSVGPICGKSSR